MDPAVFAHTISCLAARDWYPLARCGPVLGRAYLTSYQGRVCKMQSRPRFARLWLRFATVVPAVRVHSHRGGAPDWRQRRRGSAIAGSLAALLFSLALASAYGPADGGGDLALAAGTISLAPVASGFSQPLFVTHAGDGSGRLFVVERGGTVKIVQGGQVLASPFLDISSRITAAGSEQGLLGLAFHPNYATNGRLFIAYTATDMANTVAECHVSTDPNHADCNPTDVLVAIADRFSNHNGGMLTFGPDG